ncbi:MAG: class I SAM-dependent methyltransferase [Bacteroidia bacterium]|nr:class I SAM-dependent methyltransferase [Bacteroidia bacterium]
MSNFIPPFRIHLLRKYSPTKQCEVLDIGSGSHSATITKKHFPSCHYTGVDRDQNYDNDPADVANMDNFIQLDLTELQFDGIKDNHYDIIVMSHIIEHLYNGDEVVRLLQTKLKKGGIFYVEFPCEASTKFPSKKGTLNFYDDETHVRIYSIEEVSSIFKTGGFNVLKSGKNRRLINILLMPIKIVWQKLRLGYVKGGVYWDWYGFADYVVAKKN